jgi:hypothetical protein
MQHSFFILYKHVFVRLLHNGQALVVPLENLVIKSSQK